MEQHGGRAKRSSGYAHRHTSVAGAGALSKAVALTLLAVTGVASAQVPAPPPGGILKDLERSLPGQSLTPSQGVQIDMPAASTSDADSGSGRIAVQGYRITGNEAFDQATLQAVIAERTGQMSLAELNAVTDELTAYYRAHGYPLARAYLPKQEIEQGVATIAVLEGRYDQIETRNRARISDVRVKRTLQGAACRDSNGCEGALIGRKPLERGLMLLNDTPGAQAAARLSPGNTVGTSTLTVDTTADRLFAGSTQFDNAGNYYSGIARAIGTLWVNSPAHIGDQITAQAIVSGIHGNLYYGTFGYGVPLGYSGARLGVRSAYLHYDLGDRYSSLDAHGAVVSTDASLFYPFVRARAANWTGSLTYGERRFRDFVDAVDTDSERTIRNRSDVALNGDFQDGLFGATAINTVSAVYTLGEVHLDSALRAVDALSARTDGYYEKWGGSYSRLQGIVGKTSLYVRLVAQGSSQNLDSYEKFALGGPDSVRAYPAGDTLVDKSLLYSVELRQGFSVPWARAVEGTLFYDRARGHLNAVPWASSANRATLSGIGIGLNCSLSERVALRSTLAFRGDRRMTAAPDSSIQYGLSLSAAF